jgi:diguanylate cyclase (GGDEF)-like protein
MKKSPNENKVFQEIQKLNELIENYIHSTIDQRDTDGEQSISLFSDGKALGKRKCWEINNCKQLDCPCRTGEDYRCWLIEGRLDQGCCQGTFAQKFRTCNTCDVFKQYSDTPLNALYENINILIKHFVDKIKMERELAIKDGLTGLYNRKFLNMIKKEDMLRLDDQSFCLSVIIFDLDMLKEVNDTYGHLMGDKMIKELSNFLIKNKRNNDILFRLGGDEFLLMMSGIDKERRVQTENRLINLLKNWNKRRKKAIPIPLSFSLGGATGFWGKDIDKIISEADKKMYVHKMSKQNSNL